MPRIKEFINRISNFIKNHKKFLLLIIPIIIILYLVFRPNNSNKVLTESVKNQDIIKTISVTGNVDAQGSANLSFLTSGKLVYLGAKEGDSIKKGTTIASLDTRTVTTNLQNAVIDFSKQKNTFEQTKYDNKDKPITDSISRILQNNQYDLDKAVNSVELQNLAKENSFLVSPIDGIITRMDAKTIGVNVTPTMIFNITDPTSLNFTMEVDEADIGQIKEDQNVEVILDSFPKEKLNLKVDSIDFVSHKTSSGGNAFYVKATLPETSNKYRVGMGGNADIITDQKLGVISVSSTSITEDNFVFVKVNNKFKKTKITRGIESDILTEITSGLQSGQEIALDPTSLKPSQIIN